MRVFRPTVILNIKKKEILDKIKTKDRNEKTET